MNGSRRKEPKLFYAVHGVIARAVVRDCEWTRRGSAAKATTRSRQLRTDPPPWTLLKIRSTVSSPTPPLQKQHLTTPLLLYLLLLPLQVPQQMTRRRR